jgi:hypothetical protein
MSKARWITVADVVFAAVAAMLFGILVAAGVSGGRAAIIAIFEARAAAALVPAVIWLQIGRTRSGRERMAAVLPAFPRLV